MVPHDAILWTIRASAICFLVALTNTVAGRARLAWIAGCALYLAHVAVAFAFRHHWSHGSALVETARQTEAVFGAATGFGLWVNYAFTAAWTVDAAAWWTSAAPASYARQPHHRAMRAFAAFMFFNGAVVFAAGPTRWAGLAATALLTVWWWRVRTRHSLEPPTAGTTDPTPRPTPDRSAPSTCRPRS